MTTKRALLVTIPVVIIGGLGFAAYKFSKEMSLAIAHAMLIGFPIFGADKKNVRW